MMASRSDGGEKKLKKNFQKFSSDVRNRSHSNLTRNHEIWIGSVYFQPKQPCFPFEKTLFSLQRSNSFQRGRMVQVFSSKNICEVTLLDQTPAFVFVTCHLGGKQNSNVCKAAVFFNLVKKHFSVKWSKLRHCSHLP